MKKINILFQLEPGRSDIGVTVSASEQDEEVLALMHRIGQPLSAVLMVTDGRGAAVSLPLERIIRIFSEGRKLKVVAEENTYTMNATLREAEEALQHPGFLRISRYEIIHLDKVQKFDFSMAGTLRIELKDGSETWASRRYIAEIRKRLHRKG